MQRPQIEIGAGHVGDQRNQHGVARGDGGVDVVLSRLDGTAEFAENVDLPGRIEPDEIDDLRQARTVLGGNKRLRGAATP